jgi:hypothetical protein
MATTTIQIHHEQDISCDIFYGAPITKIEKADGYEAIFDENGLVIYCISKGRKQRAYLFKTCSNGNDFIPGVNPAVQLLIAATSRERVSRLLAVFTSLSRRNFDASKLDDNFFIRLNTLIENRTFRISDALSLLKNENQLTQQTSLYEKEN